VEKELKEVGSAEEVTIMVLKAEQLREGVVVKGDFWPEEIRIHVAKVLGKRIQVIGAGLKTQKSYSTIHYLDDFEKKVQIVFGLEGPKFSANAKRFRLALEATRIRMSYEFDPLFAVGVSKVDSLPHQIEAVYDYLLKRPRIRFLLADDPGAGKTIMAGLLLKELKYRGAVESVLIVSPPNLIPNWKKELFEKFDETVIEVSRGSFSSSYANVWEQGHQFIVSMDTVKKDDLLETLKDVYWDLVIVDEAHKLSAYQFGQKTEKSQRYRLGEVLSENCEHLLFLTATPHKGDPDNFLLLLSLLDKNLYANTEFLREAIRKNENPNMLRRLKEDMVDENGKPLFPLRKVHTVPYELTAQEKNLYDAVTEYVTKHFERATRSMYKNAVGFALIVLQRRLASSLRAIRKSLERRKNRLAERLLHWDSYKEELMKDLSDEEIAEIDEDMAEKDRWEQEQKLLSLTTAQNRDELEAEIREVERLVELAKEVERTGPEKKLNELKGVLFDVEEIRNTSEKLLIFTEHKDTCDYLMEKVQQWGFSVTSIDGTMDKYQREKAMEEFQTKTQVMVATEAAGEGINLQFCSLMINYDIPWNPTRLEQRMGRIHRYKQKKEVHIYNLIATNTREGHVLRVILDKLEQMRNHLGSDRVYDVIDDLLEEDNVRLDQLIRESIRSRVTFEEFCRKWQRPITEDDVEKLKRATEEALAVRHVDLSKYREKMQISEEQRLIPEYIEQFFVEAFSDLGGTLTKVDKSVWRIDNVPVEIRRALPKSFQQEVKRYYSKVSFHKDVVKDFEEKNIECEYIAPGSLLFESVCELVLKKYGSLLREGAVFLDPEGNEEVMLWFVLGKVTDGKGRKIGERLFAILQNSSDEFVEKGAFVLWDLNPASSPVDFLGFGGNVHEEAQKVSMWTLNSLVDPYFEEIREQRMRELDIRKKYVERSLDYLIKESIKRLGVLRGKEKKGMDMRIAITSEVRRQEELIVRKDEALKEIEQERNLSPSMPEVIATIGIVPLRTTDAEMSEAMKRDEEIERIAMDEAKKYEERHARKWDDVSDQNLGYDIKSRGKGELRYIEVKGRARIAKIVLTPNEWIKANRFKDNYWLYVVANCVAKPELYLIQDPASKLKPDQVVEVTRYVVDLQQWRQIAKRVDEHNG
jgi:superfamily II DNA or RNA helicase